MIGGPDFEKAFLYLFALAGLGLIGLFALLLYGLWFLVHHLSWVG